MIVKSYVSNKNKRYLPRLEKKRETLFDDLLKGYEVMNKYVA